MENTGNASHTENWKNSLLPGNVMRKKHVKKIINPQFKVVFNSNFLLSSKECTKPVCSLLQQAGTANLTSFPSGFEREDAITCLPCHGVQALLHTQGLLSPCPHTLTTFTSTCIRAPEHVLSSLHCNTTISSLSSACGSW